MPHVASATYVLEGYVEADDALRDYARTGDGTALIRAHAALCRALSKLEADGPFWDELAHSRTTADDARTHGSVEELDALLGLEQRVLREAGLPERVLE